MVDYRDNAHLTRTVDGRTSARDEPFLGLLDVCGRVTGRTPTTAKHGVLVVALVPYGQPTRCCSWPCDSSKKITAKCKSLILPTVSKSIRTRTLPRLPPSAATCCCASPGPARCTARKPRQRWLRNAREQTGNVSLCSYAATVPGRRWEEAAAVRNPP